MKLLEVTNTTWENLQIGPLRIDVTVTAKWPLWVLRNVTLFMLSHFRQSSEQIFLVLVLFFLKTVSSEFVLMLREQHIWKAKHFLDIFLTDSSQKVSVLPLWRHAGAANNARTSHFSRMLASITCTDFQRQPSADDWPAKRSRRMNQPVSPCLRTSASVQGWALT